MGRKGSKPLSLAEKKEIEVLVAAGESYHAVGRKLARDPKTIKSYATRAEVAASIQETQQELADMFEGAARRMLGSIGEEDIKKINAYQRAIASCALIDKVRLLRDQSTANIAVGLARLVEQADEHERRRLGVTVDVAALPEATPSSSESHDPSPTDVDPVAGDLAPGSQPGHLGRPPRGSESPPEEVSRSAFTPSAITRRNSPPTTKAEPSAQGTTEDKSKRRRKGHRGRPCE